ncbi:aldo/keto reductase [Sphingomonas sp. AR_OL41]|uniref:aldo/keto reductase n=1 Tax=Sphingomonas sp. AR_OL41 TaxID=3042729 RepID=UPI002480B537|nr:aldo/keto reductase [Sphingomonas sp. AR_OL41]MDH7973902.1 aldo/keto reductase [Sphingomonas sp. AR_OL41]
MTKSANGGEEEARGGVGLGCAPLGNLYRPMPDHEARAIADAAWDAGVRYFDTAPLYGFGLSERRIGDALRARPRDSFTLSTKVGRVLEPDRSAGIAAARDGFASPMPFTPRYDYSYDGVMRSYEASLQRLGLARIDTVLVHDIGYATHGADNDRHLSDLASGGYRALDALRAAGDIVEIGLGVNEWQACVAAMELGRFDCFLLAGRYTLLEQEALDRFFPACAAHGASVILGGIYNSGILATGTRQAGGAHYDYAPAPVEILARTRRLERLCEAHGVDLAAAALQFALAPPIVRAVIPGIGEERQVRETFRHLSARIPAAFWQELKSLGLIAANAPVPAAAR